MSDSSRLPPFPPPPPRLDKRPLPLVTRDHPWYRLHRREYGAVYFGRKRLFRFDAPTGEYGVLYAAHDLRGVFVEGILGDLPPGSGLVTEEHIDSRRIAEINFPRPLRLVDLTGEGLWRIGADERLTSGNYEDTQPWSRALWAHPDEPDGILYRSRLDSNCLNAAVFDRVAGKDVLAQSLGSFLDEDHCQKLAEFLDLYGLSLIGRTPRRRKRAGGG